MMWHWMLAAALLCISCEARNFKYASQLTMDEYLNYKNGITEGAFGTLFPLHPAQIFSCQFDIGYAHFHDFIEGPRAPDVFQFINGHMTDYYEYVPEHMFQAWSSCYQNFVTRYCMQIIHTEENRAAAIYKIRQCKHMYFLKTPETRYPMTYLVREVKPYINFHMREHIYEDRTYQDSFDKQGLHPAGFEYFINWEAFGYASSPSGTYKSFVAKSYTEVIHGVFPWEHAYFTILADSWKMKLFHMAHEMAWTVVSNNRGILTHELINAYQDLDHIQLHYLAHMCTTMLEPNPPGIRRTKDILHPEMCPNPCRDKSVCSHRPYTDGGECTPIGVGNLDFRCECVAGYTWNQISQNCDESFDCNRDCVANNTRHCHFVPVESKQPHEVGQDRVNGREGHLRCTCYPEFEGERCDRPRDACVTGADGSQSGNELCRVDLGGRCIPKIGTNHYVCSCPKKFRTLHSLSEDNCLMMRTACDAVICANNGACHNSPDGANFECECTDGFEGALCDVQIAYQWTFWSDWSSCDPLCGQGWQVSRRMCWDRMLGRPDVPSRCPGDSDSLRICHKHCLTEIQANHYIAIDLCLDLLFRMLIAVAGCYLFINILFRLMFRESDFVYVRYLRTTVVDLIRRVVGGPEI